ncbi:globin domain-containing protein [Spirillospora sp. NPDC047279]|uniref:globin domain-containing protein n=1 Tax=Spirillospora sp. NPDC047279 TaxID=3155478 RepID=UPI0033EA683F
MDPQRLKDNFALVGQNGEDVAAYFYADLFEREPAVRSLFPAAMVKQQEKLLTALSHIVSLVDDAPALVPFVQDLGRRHAGFGVSNEHYPVVGASLLATLAYFSGPAWNDELEQDWAAAYGLVAQVMAEAAAEAADQPV